MYVYGAYSRYQSDESQLYGALASPHSCLDAVHTSNTVLLRRDSKPTVQSKLCDPDESCSRGGLSVRLATCHIFLSLCCPRLKGNFYV